MIRIEFTREFISGPLAGIRHDDSISYPALTSAVAEMWSIGREVTDITGNRYRIIKSRVVGIIRRTPKQFG